jgi:hypothetical protein
LIDLAAHWVEKEIHTPHTHATHNHASTAYTPQQQQQKTQHNTNRAQTQNKNTHPKQKENGFMGMGVGAAMTGLRPIVEGMNMGFLLLAFNQISNNCGMLHYTSGGQYKTPLVIRGPGGVGRQLGAEHSQRLESYFQSIPGVQLVAVSTTANAKALLKSAIRSDNPIIFFEHVLLYNIKGEPHEGDYCQPLEKAELVREGADVSIFTYSRMRYVVMQAVAELEKKGYNPEVRRFCCWGVCLCAAVVCAVFLLLCVLVWLLLCVCRVCCCFVLVLFHVCVYLVFVFFRAVCVAPPMRGRCCRMCAAAAPAAPLPHMPCTKMYDEKKPGT